MWGVTMGLKSELERLPSTVKDLLSTPSLRAAGKTGIYMVLCRKNGAIVFNSSFGVCEGEFGKTAFENLKWMWKHKDCYSSVEDNKESSSGAVSGRKFILSIAGLDPGYNSAVALLLLYSLERDLTYDLVEWNARIDSARCENELAVLAEHLEKLELYRILPEILTDFFRDVQKMHEFKVSKQTGFCVEIFDKMTGDLILEKCIGLMNMDATDEYFMSARKNAQWCFMNPTSVSSRKNNGEASPGAISGHKHIVSVAGLDPGYNSCFAFFILSVLEICYEKKFREAYIKESGCLNELYSLVFFLTKNGRHPEIEMKFGWVRNLVETFEE